MVWALDKCGDGCPKCPPICPSGFPMSRETIPNVSLDSSPDVGLKVYTTKEIMEMEFDENGNPKNGDGGGGTAIKG